MDKSTALLYPYPVGYLHNGKLEIFDDLVTSIRQAETVVKDTYETVSCVVRNDPVHMGAMFYVQFSAPTSESLTDAVHDFIDAAGMPEHVKGGYQFVESLFDGYGKELKRDLSNGLLSKHVVNKKN